MTKRLFQCTIFCLGLFSLLILLGCETSNGEEPIKHTVVFLDADEEVIHTVNVIEGEAATAPTPPEKLDHTFLDWDVAFDNVQKTLIVRPLYEPLTSTGWRFTLDSDTACIVEYVGEETELILPKTLAGLPVTCIAQNAFLDNETVTSVLIPATVQTIGQEAFRDSALVTVTFEDNSDLKELSAGVFRNARTLSTIDFGTNSKLKTIGPDVFRSTPALTHIELPNTITTMGARVFHHSGLESIHLPDSLEAIPESAFDRARALQEVTMSEESQLKRIHAFAFQHSALTSMHIPATVLIIEEGAFLETAHLETVTFAENSLLTLIEKGVFSRSGLQSITLPESLMAIEDYAFERTNLESITLPSNVIVIGLGAFSHNAYLQTVLLNDGLQVIHTAAFAETPELMTIRIPQSVIGIGHSAFSGNDNRTIYLEVRQKPASWADDWYDEAATIIWHEEPI